MPFLLLYFIFIVFGMVGFLMLMILLFLGFLIMLIKKRTALMNLFSAKSKYGVSHMTLYETKNGAKVFASGSMQWAWGLDDYNAPQLRTSRKQEVAEIITKNLLDILVD